jgi:hypothetical protein
MSDWTPTTATLRDGEHTEDAHARRNLAQLRQGLADGIIDPADLSADRRAQLGLDGGAHR